MCVYLFDNSGATESKIMQFETSVLSTLSHSSTRECARVCMCVYVYYFFNQQVASLCSSGKTISRYPAIPRTLQRDRPR